MILPRVCYSYYHVGIYFQLVTNSWRVVYESDPVPQIVPKRLALQPYAYHTKGEVLYQENVSLLSNYTICKENEVM